MKYHYFVSFTYLSLDGKRELTANMEVVRYSEITKFSDTMEMARSIEDKSSCYSHVTIMFYTLLRVEKLSTITNSSYFRKYDEHKYCDLDGNIVENNPVEHPYSYDPYVIYKSSNYKKWDVPFNSDKVMYSIGSEVNNALHEMKLKRYGDKRERFSWKNPHHVTRFMSILMKQDVECTAIVECCGKGGYPYWIVYLH